MKIFLLAVSLLLLSPAVFAQDESAASIACPMIAKPCPDGSSVSPRGPRCEMPACPGSGNSSSNLRTHAPPPSAIANAPWPPGHDDPGPPPMDNVDKVRP